MAEEAISREKKMLALTKPSNNYSQNLTCSKANQELTSRLENLEAKSNSK